MATIKFRVSKKADKSSGQCEVLIRFFHGKIDQYAKTNVFIQPEYWNTKTERLTIPRVRVMTSEAKQLVADLSDLNTRLEAIKEYVNQSFIEAGAGKTQLPATWLSDILNRYNFPVEAVKTTFLDLFSHYIDITKVAESRKRHFRVVWRAFKRFCLFQDIDTAIDLESIDSEMIRAFVAYLEKEHTYFEFATDKDGKRTVVFLNSKFETAYKNVPESRWPEPRGQNAINHFLAELRTFYKWAIKNDYTTNDPFVKYSIPASIYGTPYYITIEERNQLLQFDLSEYPQLEVQRDIFVFQCVIGCRVSDLRNLTKDCVINGAIEYIPRKTKEGQPVTVRVPLNAVATSILEKYKDIPGNMLLPCITDQHYNYAIKDIFKMAGLTRPVTILNPTTRMEEKRPLNEVASSHLARRCFIGNLYKQVKDPNLIGKLSGHVEGSKAFARYRDIDEDMRKELVTMLE